MTQSDTDATHSAPEPSEVSLKIAAGAVRARPEPQTQTADVSSRLGSVRLALADSVGFSTMVLVSLQALFIGIAAAQSPSGPTAGVLYHLYTKFYEHRHRRNPKAHLESQTERRASVEHAEQKGVSTMKTLLLASTVALAVANLSPAFANAGPKTFASGSVQQGTAAEAPRILHWEWQYGYIGHHARYAPHWVLAW